MEFFKLFLVVVALVALALFGLATRVVFKKNGKFPNLHIGSNKHLRQKGITCAQTFDKVEQAKARKELSFKELSILEDFKGGC
ncbi:hypothetical protein ACUNWD_04985 [Sunxiuqinia sp. A32]|uniref:hypothetical protein n=1 Tax=Sunxiuqinia sp. A32 TaxID=3461496 RepID=UPI004045A40D